MPPMDRIDGYLEVGVTEDGQQIGINFDRDRTGHILFSAAQARSLAELLLTKVEELEFPSDVVYDPIDMGMTSPYWESGWQLGHDDEMGAFIVRDEAGKYIEQGQTAREAVVAVNARLEKRSHV